MATARTTYVPGWSNGKGPAYVSAAAASGEAPSFVYRTVPMGAVPAQEMETGTPAMYVPAAKLMTGRQAWVSTIHEAVTEALGVKPNLVATATTALVAG